MGHSLTLLLGAMRLQADILMQWLEDGTGVMVAGKRLQRPCGKKVNAVNHLWLCSEV